MLYDISPCLRNKIAVWPGDMPLSRQVICDITRGSNITLSSLTATVHLGSHADAPSHYGINGQSIDQRDINYYFGPCQLVRVNVGKGYCIEPRDLTEPITVERVLLATGTYPDSEHFNEDFVALSPDLVEMLHEKGVRLIGIDTPSVDPFSSKDLPAHKMFLKHDMAILEGLVLKDVPAGMYELIALPLKLVGFDASPVRAILRSPDPG